MLRDFDDCKTARIDDEPRDVDFHRSTGLLGARRIGRSLYLHLSQPDARVVLAHNPKPHVHVREANCILRHAVIARHAVEFTAEAVQERTITLAGFKPEASVTLEWDGQQRLTTADEKGRVNIRLKGGGKTRVVASTNP
ncbi:MAG: hypothetical protein AAF525_05695 [Pseudomonadota bacterium]